MKKRIVTQLGRVAAWGSQTLNVWLLMGHHDQTVSARCYVNRHNKWWNLCRNIVNTIFFWETDHCKKSFLKDVEYAKEILNYHTTEKDNDRKC